jgi:lipopolysaccharide transport system ATP-binding protein
MSTISVRNLSKEFRLVTGRTSYRTLRDAFSLRRNDSRSQNITSFMALRNVSFEAHAGDIIGILGRNGAGKSTLLKILSRILRPTTGRIEMSGRVGSLLEVGSGFHGELTGRENIFLNGAILGMKHREIAGKLDQIIEFAGVGQYIDQPVKHYSSGMYMRLAFSVAAHIEPEILLVDEVLAVGDAEFQKKCLRRIEQVGHNGQTVLFVSHNLDAMLRLCNRAMVIEHGELVDSGPIHEVAASYLKLREPNQGESCYAGCGIYPGNDVAKLRSVRIRSHGDSTLTEVAVGQEFGIEMEFEVLNGPAVVFPVLSIYNQWDTQVLWATDARTEWHGRPRPSGTYRTTGWVPGDLLPAGPMRVTVAMYSLGPRVQHFCQADAVGFQVLDSTDSESARGKFTDPVEAATMPRLRWDVEYSSLGEFVDTLHCPPA